MWRRKFLTGVIGVFVLTQAAQAQSVDTVVRKFGMVGTWATDCGQPPSPSNSYSTIVAASGRVTQSYDFGPSRGKNVYSIKSAVIRGDKIETEELFQGDNTKMAVTTVKQGEKMRVWSSKVAGGKVLVVDGVILGSRETKWLTRCR